MMVAGVSGARAAGLSRFLEPARGVTLLMEVASRKQFTNHSESLRFLLPPGSTLKPFVLASLMASGKLTPQTSSVCPLHLTIQGRRLDCSHPPIATAIDVRTALAYSCNCYVAKMAERFEPYELHRELAAFGLATHARRAALEQQKLQALGANAIQVTAVDLATAYRQLALRATQPVFSTIVEGMEDAVQFGTAQLASVKGQQIAGKTGSAVTQNGTRVAWFAGFMPSRAPKVVSVVMLSGHSGGSDAAPIAAEILSAYARGELRG